MSTVEDRLSSALHARADLVQAHDLRAPEVPQVTALPPAWRRPAAYAVLAAACVVAVAVPVGLELADKPRETAPADGAGWPVVEDISGYDLDGDGAGDDVTLRVPEDGGRARVDVTYADGRAAYRVLDGATAPTRIIGAAATTIGPQQALVLGGSGNGDVTVLLAEGDELVSPARTEEPFYEGVRDTVVGDVWVDEEVLRSSVSHEGGYVAGQVPDDYAVEAYEWTVTADGLVRGEAMRELCVVGGADPAPCDASGAGTGDQPRFYPGPAEPVGVGDSFTATVADVPWTVSLEGTADGEEVEAGEVELVLTGPGAGARVPIPAGYRPHVDRVLVDLASGFPGILVTQQIGDTDGTMHVYWWDGTTLRDLRVDPGVRLGSAGVTNVTWLNDRGELFTRNGSGEDGAPYRTWRWLLSSENTLTPELVGTYCFDFAADPVTWETCS